jgi:GT2 family glycosyltransferase
MTGSQPETTAVIIVNWNGWRDTLEASASLIKWGGPNAKLILVDNASTDDSVVRLRKQLPTAELIANSVNAGFAGGCNLGIRRALELGCKYVFLLNNDAIIGPKTVSELIIASKRLNDCAILGSVVRYTNARGYQFFGSQRIEATGQPRWFEYTRDHAQLTCPLIESDFILGAALFAPSEIFRDVGEFDERFYLTYEDVDLCYRARARGIRSFVVTSSEVEHYASATMGPVEAPLQSYFLARNELLFIEKHCNRSLRLVMHARRLRRLIWRISQATVARRLSDPSTIAMICGFRDYGLRRFGDCPRRIRIYATAYGSAITPNLCTRAS